MGGYDFPNQPPMTPEEQARARAAQAEWLSKYGNTQPFEGENADLMLGDRNKLNGWWGQSRDAYDADIARAQGNQALSFGQAQDDRARGLEARSYQAQQASRLAHLANGEGPSLANLQYQQLQAQSLAAQQSAANSARGGNFGLANRQAAAAAMQQRVAGVNTAAQLGIQERMAAEGMLAGTANQMRGGDLADRGQNLGREGGWLDYEGKVKGTQQQTYAGQYGADVARKEQPGIWEKGAQGMAAAYSAFSGGNKK